MTSFKNLKRQIHCCSIGFSFLDSMFLFFIKISLQEQLKWFLSCQYLIANLWHQAVYNLSPWNVTPQLLVIYTSFKAYKTESFFICCLLIILQSKETFCFALFCFGLMQIAPKPHVPCSCSVDFSYTFFYLFNYSFPVCGILSLASYILDCWP